MMVYCAVFYPVLPLPKIPKGVTDSLDTFIGAMDRKSSVEAFDRLQVQIHFAAKLSSETRKASQISTRRNLYEIHNFKN